MHIVLETLSETQVSEDVSGVEMENQLPPSQDDTSDLDSTPCVQEFETPNISDSLVGVILLVLIITLELIIF